MGRRNNTPAARFGSAGFTDYMGFLSRLNLIKRHPTHKSIMGFLGFVGWRVVVFDASF